jgi:hypothetical protein
MYVQKKKNVRNRKIPFWPCSKGIRARLLAYWGVANAAGFINKGFHFRVFLPSQDLGQVLLSI